MSNNEKRKKIFLIAAAVSLVTLCTLLPFIFEKSAGSGEAKASILTGTVTRGSISTVLSGTGTLSGEGPRISSFRTAPK